MFRLTNKLAVSNLIKNRKLYYPFALAVLLAVTVTYLFYSLTFNPKIAEIRGGTTIQATLGFGMFVVTLASAIIVLYANSFVMKNRSKELGIYGMLGLEKRHLISMTFKELVVFGILTVGAGIGIGALFDKLIFAFLLKLMKLKVELVATFQTKVVITVLVVFGLIFLGLMFLNALRIARMNALQLSREKASGEKKRSLPSSPNHSWFHKFRNWLLSCPYGKRSSYSLNNLLHSCFTGYLWDLSLV